MCSSHTEICAGFASLNSEPRSPTAAAAGALVSPPLSDGHPQQVVPQQAGWSKTAAVLADANPQQPQQQQVSCAHQQAARSGEGLQEEQQQQQVLQQCDAQQQSRYGQQQQLGYLSEQQPVRQADAHVSTMQQQQQQQAARCLGAESYTGSLVQQQQEDDQEGMQLFSCAQTMEEDLKAYATLVHGAHSR